jgi:hypothetical protein
MTESRNPLCIGGLDNDRRGSRTHDLRIKRQSHRPSSLGEFPYGARRNTGTCRTAETSVPEIPTLNLVRLLVQLSAAVETLGNGSSVR